MDCRSRARGRRLGVTLRVERFPRQMAAVKMNPGCGAGWIWASYPPCQGALSGKGPHRCDGDGQIPSTAATWPIRGQALLRRGSGHAGLPGRSRVRHARERNGGRSIPKYWSFGRRRRVHRERAAGLLRPVKPMLRPSASGPMDLHSLREGGLLASKPAVRAGGEDLAEFPGGAAIAAEPGGNAPNRRAELPMVRADDWHLGGGLFRERFHPFTVHVFGSRRTPGSGQRPVPPAQRLPYT